MTTPKRTSAKKSALRFIIFFGIVSLFADMTYEGARSVTGAYLGFLGASATFVGFIAGFSELLGYGLRFFSGFFADYSKKYWAITLTGYVINLIAIPLLAFTHHPWSAACFILLERAGKAIRVPARDTLLSHAGETVGMGFGFGLHEALDQLGAMTGPLIVALILFLQQDYRFAFAMLAIPALCSLATLFSLRFHYPQPENLAPAHEEIATRDINRTFWIYVIGAAFVAAGFADFPLIAYHFQKAGVLTPAFIPVSYALAMGVNSLMSLVLGHLYDRWGLKTLILMTLAAAFFAPLVFLGNVLMAFCGVVLWALGIGAQQILMRAFIGKLIRKNQRASAYGIFNFAFGVSWFVGSALMGIIYDYSLIMLVVFIMGLQLLALPWFIYVLLIDE